jgi:hypothetical protein
MCALVLALRKVPIYAPGGGDAVLGDVGKPTYAVTISDQEAARNRDEFAAKKEAKRLIPSEPAAPPKDEGSKGHSSGVDYSTVSKESPKPAGTAVRPSTGNTSERTAVDDLHQRTAGVDAARDDWDSYRDGLSNPNIANRRESGASTGLDSELSEVRGMLSRESTRGRRRPAPPSKPAVEVIPQAATQPPSSSSSPSSQAQGPTGTPLAQSNISIHDQAYQPAAREPRTLHQAASPAPQAEQSPTLPAQAPALYQQPGGRMSPIPQPPYSHPASSIVAAANQNNAGRLRSDSSNGRLRGDSMASSNAHVSPPTGRTGNAFAAGSPIQPLNLVQQQQQQQAQSQGQGPQGQFRAASGYPGGGRAFGPN